MLAQRAGHRRSRLAHRRAVVEKRESRYYLKITAYADELLSAWTICRLAGRSS